MRVYADSLSIHEACGQVRCIELDKLISLRIEELAEYEVDDLSSLIKILVLAPSDALATVDAELGFSLLGRHCDVAESHREWFELTLVLSDNGFGVVIYVPKHADLDPLLTAYCASQVRARSQ
ncbi:hypothetical protein GY14_30435 [Delftia tsuruhatensis]|uniref:hypothetical protein n=1 Tax=uncultured Delftia sp. TaxID=191464 RepID=UPI0004DAB7AF|nr:hypothetical protein [uncultured Delftia sp.]KEH07051.1 hypothetical protein GY14_30435 [Delftia tsuruhatensis]